MPYKLKSGKWQATVTREGKRYTKDCETKKEALDWEAEKRAELKAHPSPRNLIFLRDVAAKYLAWVKKRYSTQTLRDKKRVLKELGSVVGNIPIDQIRSEVILNDIILRKSTPNLANRTRKNLHSFFAFCQSFYSLPTTNPISRIDKLPHKRKPQPVPTEEEFLRMLLACDRQDKNLLITLASTGARRSEVFRLTWTDDINFKQRTVRLWNRKGRGGEIRERWIQMNEMLYEALQDQLNNRLPDSDYVFQNRAVWTRGDGSIRRHPNYGQRYTARRKFMRGLCKKAGVKNVGFHGIRRFFGSMLTDNRESLETIRRLLGHSRVSTTDLYIKNIKADTSRDAREGVSKIDFRAKIQDQIQEEDGKYG